MNSSKLIYFIFTLLIGIPFHVFTMEFGHQQPLQHNKPLELTHQIKHAVAQFLHKNHLTHTEQPVLTQNNNLFLQVHTSLNTAVVVFNMPDVLRLAPISNQEANRAHNLFKVYDLKHNSGIWSVMFDYAKRGLLPTCPAQAAFLLVAPYLKDMPRTSELVNPPFLSPEQQQALCTVSAPDQLAECKAMLKNSALIEVFKIEQPGNTLTQKQNLESNHVIALLNTILEKYHADNTEQKNVCYEQLTALLDQAWELRDREGFALGTVIQTGSDCKKIEEIQINDLVAARNFAKDTQTLSRVVNVYKEQITTYFQIILDTETINAAPDQKFYLPGKEQEVTAFELSKSRELQAAFSGSILEIRQIDEPIDVYKLVVEDNHNFHVSSKELLAHNYTPSLYYTYSPSNHASDNIHFRVECSNRVPMQYTRHQQVYAQPHNQLHQMYEQKKALSLGQGVELLSRKDVRKGFFNHLNNTQKIVAESRSLQAIYQAYGFGNSARLEQRNALIQQSQSQRRKWHYKHQNYELSKKATELLHNTKADAAMFKTCYGNPLQQFIHQDCISIVEIAATLPPESVFYDQRTNLVDWAQAACAYNQVGETTKAMHLTDLCHALVDHGKAIAEGAALGVIGVVEYAIDHPIETIACIVASEYVLAYQLTKVLVEVADIGIDMLMKPDQGTEKWNEFIAPVTQVLDVLNGKSKLSSRDVCKMGACALVSWKAQGKVNRGLGKLYSGAKVKALAYAKGNPLATPQQYLATADGINYKFAYNAQKPENIKEAILATGIRNTQCELTLPKVKTYEQARNLALEIIGEVNPHTGKPVIGKQGVCIGKICGRQWHNRKVEMRLDHDPIKGPHINVTDWRLGRGKNGIDVAIPFEGNKDLVTSLLKHLQ